MLGWKTSWRVGFQQTLKRMQHRRLQHPLLASTASYSGGGGGGGGAPRLLLKNASQVVTVGGGSAPKLGSAMGDVEVLANHSLLVSEDGLISDIVPAGAPTDALLQRNQHRVDHVVDCAGKVVMPGFVDGHTHAVFDGDRSHEHAMKLAGATYEQV